MPEKYIKFDKTINDIEFKMLRKNDDCWIKVVPTTQNSTPSSLHIMVNGEDHHWNIYDESQRDVHKVYFKGNKITPSFYLKSDRDYFRIDFKFDGIKVIPITENHKMEIYLKKYCNCYSTQISCWAIAIYNTSLREESPFNEM